MLGVGMPSAEQAIKMSSPLRATNSFCKSGDKDGGTKTSYYGYNINATTHSELQPKFTKATCRSREEFTTYLLQMTTLCLPATLIFALNDQSLP